VHTNTSKSVPVEVWILYGVQLHTTGFNSVRTEYSNHVVIFPQLSPAVLVGMLSSVVIVTLSLTELCMVITTPSRAY